MSSQPYGPNQVSTSGAFTFDYSQAGGGQMISPTITAPSITIPNGGDDIISISNEGKHVVTLKGDGTVIWENGTVDIDPAADAFGQVLKYSAVNAHGITSRVREDLRLEGWNAAFKHLTELAAMNGNLSFEDLTNERNYCTLVKKLKE